MLFLWRSDGYDRFCSLACEVSSSVNFIAPGVSSVPRTTAVTNRVDTGRTSRTSKPVRRAIAAQDEGNRGD